MADVTLGPALFETLRAAQRELGLVHQNRPTCRFLRPHILPRARYETVKRAAETLAGAFEKIEVSIFIVEYDCRGGQTALLVLEE